MKHILRRERDKRRVAKSVRSWEATKAALGKAAGWHSSYGFTGEYTSERRAVNPDSKTVFVPGAGNAHRVYENGREYFPLSEGVEHQEQTSYRTGKKKGEK